MLTICGAETVERDGDFGLGLGHQIRNGLKTGPPQGAER